MDVRLVHRFWQRFVNRGDTYCIQQANGRYQRKREPLTLDLLAGHLAGEYTLAVDSLDVNGHSRWLCFDSDTENGAALVQALHEQVTQIGLQSWQEMSRRGGHLWLWWETPQPAAALRRVAQWALAQVGTEMEVYPNSEMPSPATEVSQPVRLPLGVHQVTGQRYPFVDGDGRACHQEESEAATVWLIAQQPNTTAQLQAALLAWPVIADESVSHEWASAAVSSNEQIMGGKAGGASWGIIAWVNAQPLAQLVAATRSDVGLRRAGRGYIGWCPFHDDAAPQADGTPGTPSLYVYCDAIYGWHWKCLSHNCGAWQGRVKDPFDWLVWCAGGRWNDALIWGLKLQEEDDEQ